MLVGSICSCAVSHYTGARDETARRAQTESAACWLSRLMASDTAQKTAVMCDADMLRQLTDAGYHTQCYKYHAQGCQA